jgi:hypothetical protein
MHPWDGACPWMHSYWRAEKVVHRSVHSVVIARSAPVARLTAAPEATGSVRRNP